MQRREGEAEGAPEAEGGAREGGGEEQAWAVTADEEVQRGAALRQPRRPRPAGVCPLRPAPLLTLISVKFEGFFGRKNMRRGLHCGLIRLKFEGFFAKRPWLGRSGPSARPIRRPRKAGDVATLAGPLLDPGFM